MHIIFGNVTYWQIPILITLKFFKFKVFYLYLRAKSVHKKNEIATKLKKNNIFPLPLEFEKRISPKTSSSLCESDPDEIGYKQNIKLVPEKVLKKYCNLFSITEEEVNKLRLLIQDFVFIQQMTISGKLGIWSALYPEKKLVYVSFNFRCFYNSDTSQNIYKIIIPLDVFNYAKKIIKKILLKLFSIFVNKNNKKQKSVILGMQNFDELSKKTVAFIPHKGVVLGTKDKFLFEKTLYYSNDKNSNFNKYNILHLDYSDYPSPEKNIFWVSLNKIKISSSQIFLKTLLACLKTCYLIRSWPTFLGWIICINKYNEYIKYCEAIKKFKKLKIAMLDYDVLCPKSLILALVKNNIKTIATQERFIATFFTSYHNVIVDTYYTNSEYTANLIKKSKYYDVKNIVPVGQYRSDYLSLYKKKTIPEKISKAKENGKKILVLLGFHSPKHWYESYTSLQANWSSQISFLKDAIRLSQNLKNTYIIIRYKGLDWPLKTDSYFKNICTKLNNCENIILSENYKESFYSYKLCANADLVIAKHTSLADECLSHEIPVLFYDYTHNMKSIQSDAFDYSPSGLMCHNFEELLEKSKSLLFDNSSKLKSEITKLNKTIYYVKEKGNVKNKIILDCIRISQNK